MRDSSTRSPQVSQITPDPEWGTPTTVPQWVETWTGQSQITAAARGISSRRIVSRLLVIVAVFVLAGCGGGSSSLEVPQSFRNEVAATTTCPELDAMWGGVAIGEELAETADYDVDAYKDLLNDRAAELGCDGYG